jgi:hypothetical protein
MRKWQFFRNFAVERSSFGLNFYERRCRISRSHSFVLRFLEIIIFEQKRMACSQSIINP